MGWAGPIKEYDEDLSATTRIRILIWGSGDGYALHYDKRCKLREALKAKYPRALVNFSEELSSEVTSALGAGATVLKSQEQELYQLAVCHLCIVLDTSIGPGEEIAHFCSTVYAHKLLVLTDEKYKGSGSFAADLRKTVEQQFYTAEEYSRCNLVERAMHRARIVALKAKAYQSL